MMQNRTHTCGELRLSDAGKQVKISGWMENVRVVSANLAFVVVRDFYGTTQVVAETEDMVNTFKAITKESTISVEGVVRERDSKTDKMATGDIEIVPAKVEVLGRCQHSELPFQINRSREADETQRLNASYEFFEKICMGVYLHGRAGDAAADRFGNAGMKAMDIADAVANVLKEN